MIEGLSPEAVIGDKGYDTDALVAYIHAMGAQAVILPRSNCTEHRADDRQVYKDRTLTERFFNRIKQCRRMATRYEKLGRTFVSRLNLVCAYIWLA